MTLHPRGSVVSWRRPATLAVLMTILSLAPTLATGPVAMDWHDGWSTASRAMPVGETIELAAVPVEGLGEVTARLERFEVFAPDARIVVQGGPAVRELPIPDNVYLRGQLDARPGSRVHLTVRASGEVRGLITEAGAYWMVGVVGQRADGAPMLAVRRADPAALEAVDGGFDCRADDLRSGKREALTPPTEGTSRAVKAEARLSRAATRQAVATRGVDHTAQIAIESDFEYFQKFGNTTDATDYAADLIAFTSGVYADELATSMVISFLSLWDSAADPWDQTSTTCGFFDFGRYWNDNQTGVDRSAAYFLSGKSSNSGIGWIGVLCNNGFVFDHQGACPSLTPQVDNYGGDYSYTSGIDGIFDIDNPLVIWDIVATLHELGHNFNSPHTHCYEGLEGNAAAIDECWNAQCGQGGCFCGTISHPCGAPGTACGTLMSYCHLSFSGGLSNVAMTLGLGHAFGVEPERVPTRMGNHVAARAASNPGCLDVVVVDSIFVDGFESGNTTAWTSTGG